MAEGAAATRVVHRADLHSLLLDTVLAAGIPVHTGSKLIAVDQDAD